MKPVISLLALLALYHADGISSNIPPIYHDNSQLNASSDTIISPNVTLDNDSVGKVQNDEKLKELVEFVVVGKSTRLIDHGIEILPDKKEKKAAFDAVSLLDKLSVAQLNVDKENGKVKTIFGADVSLFIDYVPASQTDLEGLRPDDVVAVQVLQYPDNPRFQSAPFVVNFIMVKYEWGGYTKFTGIGQTLNYDSGIGRVYSKYVRNKLTIDGNVSVSFLHRDKDGSNANYVYRDVFVNDTHYDEIEKKSNSGTDFLRKRNSQLASLRLVYDGDKTYLQHNVRFSREAIPVLRSYSNIEFSPDIFDASSSFSLKSSQSVSPMASGYYFFTLPKNNSLAASWNVAYGRNKSNSFYQLGQNNPIINDNKEWAVPFNASISHSKKFNRNNTFRTSINTFNTYYNTSYMGSYDGVQKLLSSESFLFLEYMQNWKCGLSLYSRVGMSFVVGRINGENYLKEWNPRLGFQLNYKINSKHAASIEGWWGNSHPDPSNANTALVRSNELMWIQGNPDLRNVLFASSRATYTYIPFSNFNIFGVLEYEGNPKKLAHEYMIIPSYDGLVRRDVNSGNFNRYTCQLSASLKLFNKALSINGGGSLNRVVLSGIDAQKHNIAYAWIRVNGYLGNFSLGLNYETPSKQISAWSYGVLSREIPLYGVNLTYSYRDLRCSIYYNNWFSKGYESYNFDSGLYSKNGSTYNPNHAPMLRLNLIYTIAYGKKIKRNNELDSNISSTSAILK